MEPVLKTGGQKCLVGSNPTPSAIVSLAALAIGRRDRAGPEAANRAGRCLPGEEVSLAELDGLAGRHTKHRDVCVMRVQEPTSR